VKNAEKEKGKDEGKRMKTKDEDKKTTISK